MADEIPATPEDPQERTRRLLALDRAHVWHPFTQMQGWLEPAEGDEPIIIDHARGSWLFDTMGRKYLDGASSGWVNVHGHRKAEIDSAIRLQLQKVAHTALFDMASPPSIDLAAELVRRAPRFEGQPQLAKVFFAESGSTAVEAALKIAFQHWRQRGKPKKARFVALGDAYHGDTVGALSVSGIDLYQKTFQPLLFDVLRVPA